MGSIRITRHLAALAAGLALALAPAAGLADSHEMESQEKVKWDQERVTSIAQELAEAMGELRDALREQPASLDPARQRAMYAAREDVRLLANSTRHLAARLEQGSGRLETYPIYKRIGMLRRSAEENGRKALIEDALMSRITRAGELLIRIAPYYRGLEPVTEVQGEPEMQGRRGSSGDAGSAGS